jgi:Arc/MetJ-type ribon-helix-helix transcriptional regulator
MRTTVIIPDEVVAEVREHVGEGSFGRFVRDAVEQRLAALRRESLVREMEEGYAAEAESHSLDDEWAGLETEGWR